MAIVGQRSGKASISAKISRPDTTVIIDTVYMPMYPRNGKELKNL